MSRPAIVLVRLGGARAARSETMHLPSAISGHWRLGHLRNRRRRETLARDTVTDESAESSQK